MASLLYCPAVMDDSSSQGLEKADPEASHPTHYSQNKAASVSQPDSPLSSSDSSSASSSSSLSHVQSFGDDYISRVQTAQTQRSITLERYPTVISRIATHRSQHSVTVGATLGTRPSKSPLPELGDGKPYPPPLPSKEEYVVEFSGLDDPLHPQNWSTKKK